MSGLIYDCKHCGWSFGAHADWCPKHPDRKSDDDSGSAVDEPRVDGSSDAS